MAQEPSVHFKLNIPVALKDRLSAAADRSGRSLTSEIITRLEASISLADDNGLDFTYEAFEQMIRDVISGDLVDIEDRLRELEHFVGSRDMNRSR